MMVFDRDGNPIEPEAYTAFHSFTDWLTVLSAPRVLRAMQRMPTREHLLRMLDAYLPYARSARRWSLLPDQPEFRPDPQRREAAALHLRALIERWTAQDIPAEITEAARALQREEVGRDPVADWDAYDVEHELPPDQYLLWPEGIPVQHKGKG